MRCKMGLHWVEWYADSTGSWNMCLRCGLKHRQFKGEWPLLTRLKWRLVLLKEAVT